MGMALDFVKGSLISKLALPIGEYGRDVSDTLVL